ncbi:MAG: hypothetical protein PHR30_16630 [Gallionellaceae bacterium]|nr:hypothetical protein [Gallionellaceae bacterium]
MSTERARLITIRIERDLTWKALGAEVGLSLHCLYRFARGGNLNERHLARVQRWLLGQSISDGLPQKGADVPEGRVA